ncbi:MAG: phosphonate C-P lyase system protein PhnG [Actinomycetota bacterium]
MTTVPSPNPPPVADVDEARARRCELLASADRQDLLDVADACLADVEPPSSVIGPEVGTVVLTVREPVETSRFQLADVLVTRSEVIHRGAPGWAMRLGDDRPAALAAAICDAESAAAGPASDRVDALCQTTEQRLAAERQQEWDQLRPTIVTFEEMGE